MSVVARLSCHTVEHNASFITFKLQPVVPADDPHSEEIKQFFAATPTGKVHLSITEGGPYDNVIKPGDQVYLYLEKVSTDGLNVLDEADVVHVFSINLSSYQTTIGLERQQATAPYRPWFIELGVRNEVAAEMFQIADKFHVRLEPVNG